MANYYDRNEPKYNWGDGWTKKGVSEKQARYLEQLAEEADVTLQNCDQMKRGQASGLIDELRRAADGDPHARRYLAQWDKFVVL